MFIYRLLPVAALTLLTVGLTGCGTSRAAPTMGFGRVDVQNQLKREDMIIGDRVEGTSTETTYLGFISIVDGDKLMLFGIPFFKDKYAVIDAELTANPFTRAYYNALEKAGDADAVLQRSGIWEHSGIPIIYSTTTVTYSGKSIKLKTDAK